MDMLKRTAIIGELARQKHSGQLGKTAVMKLLHLLQDGLKVPLGYRFTLYTYGPYDSDVMSDIEFAESLNQVSVEYFGPDQGYSIHSKSTEVIQVDEDIKKQIKELMNLFGKMNARDLELRSTLLFLSREFKDDLLMRRLQELKPKYSAAETSSAISELKDRRFL